MNRYSFFQGHFILAVYYFKNSYFYRMEDVSKDQLKDLQNFFKQRNKQNEGINSQVIDHIGKLLSEINGSKLNEVDKIQNNKIVNALGHFIVKCNPKWTIKSQVLNGKNFVLEQPKSNLTIIDLEQFTDTNQLKKELDKIDSTDSILLVLAAENFPIETTELKEMIATLTGSIWLFNTEEGSAQKI